MVAAGRRPRCCQRDEQPRHLFAEQGADQEAERWWRAADAGDTDAMHSLGLLLGERGDDQEDERWLRQDAPTPTTPTPAEMVVAGVLTPVLRQLTVDGDGIA